MNKYFCTLFDSNYLPQAKSLHSSLLRHLDNAILYMFCMDEKSYNQLSFQNLKNVILVSYKNLESVFPQLLISKKNRNTVEYFYTCSPLICSYVFKTNPNVKLITYLDSDLYFFNSPLPLFEEMNHCSIGIIDHKFNFLTKRNKKYGDFNVGWVSFKRDTNGILCLEDWSNKCLEWCYQKLEPTRYADQKYLDYWQNDFDQVKIIENIGANLAIWNIGNYNLSYEGNTIFVNNTPLIFYHFANLKQLDKNTFSTGLSRVFVRTKGVIKNKIYIPYLNEFLSNQNNNSTSISKKDISHKFLVMFLRNFSRKIRAFIFNDIIKFNI